MLHLFFDPLCGWCYGAAPALSALQAASTLSWQMHPTGLFARPQAMDASMAEYFWSSDLRIAKMTGQVFSQEYKKNILENLQLPFDSSHATLAYHLISQALPEQALHILHRVQQLRYAEGTSQGFKQLAEEFGLNGAAFEQDFAAGWPQALKQSTADAQQFMQQQNLRGVPTLLLEKDQQFYLVPSNLLYQDPQALIDFVNQ